MTCSARHCVASSRRGRAPAGGRRGARGGRRGRPPFRVRVVIENTSGPEQIAQFELYLEAARNPALRDIASESFRAYEDVAAAALRAVGAPDPEAAAPLFVSLSDGLGLRRQAAGTAPPMDELLLALLRGGQRGSCRPLSSVGGRAPDEPPRPAVDLEPDPGSLVVAVDAPAGRELVQHPQPEALRVMAHVGVEPRAVVADLDPGVVLGEPRGEDDPVGVRQAGVADAVRDELGREQAHRVVHVRVQARADEQPTCGAGACGSARSATTTSLWV